MKSRLYRLATIIFMIIATFLGITFIFPETAPLFAGIVRFFLFGFALLLILVFALWVALRLRRRAPPAVGARARRRSRPYTPGPVARMQADGRTPPGELQRPQAGPGGPPSAQGEGPAAAPSPESTKAPAAPAIPAAPAEAATFPPVDSASPLPQRPTTPLRIVQVGDYTARRERRARGWAWALGLLALPAGAAVALGGYYLVLALLSDPGGLWLTSALGFLVAALLLALAGRAACTAADFRRGRRGEERAVAIMQRLLDGSWSLYRNVEVQGKHGGDIDLVLVGPGGLWAFEVKAYTFRTRNRRDYWDYRRRGRWRPLSEHPGRQCRAGARRLHGYLLGRGLPGVWVDAVVLWAGDPTLLTVEEPQTPVWTRSLLEGQLRSVAARPRLAPEVVREVVAALDCLAAGEAGG